MPNKAKKSSSGSWWEQVSLFASSAQQNYEQVRQQFLDRAAEDVVAAIEEHGREVIQAQIVHENMQVVQALIDEAGTQAEALKTVQDWVAKVTVETSATFSQSFASDLTGTCKETAVSFRLQLLQMANSPLNRLLRQLGGQI